MGAGPNPAHNALKAPLIRVIFFGDTTSLIYVLGYLKRYHMGFFPFNLMLTKYLINAVHTLFFLSVNLTVPR